MGMFSSKTQVTVATSISRVIEDNLIPDSVKIGMIKGLFEDDGAQFVENILEEMVGSVGMRAELMYSYAKRTYVYGLPSTTFLSNTPSPTRIKDVLQDYEGAEVAVDYSKYGPLNNLHYGWDKLISLYNYNPTTNTIGSLTTQKGTPVYLDDMAVLVSNATLAELENGSLEHWGRSPRDGYTPERPASSGNSLFKATHTPFAIDTTTTDDYLKVSYIWQETETVLVSGVSHTQLVNKKDYLVIPVVGLDPNQDYFQIKYVVNGVIKYFIYLDGTGTYPELDDMYATEHTGLGSFFPFVYFRYNKQNLASNKTTAEYKSSKKLLSYLNMDYADLAASINENPDIDDIEQVILMMGVPPDTTNPMEQRYLFDFFSEAYLKLGSKYPELFTAFRLPAVKASANPINLLVIQDAKSKVGLRWNGLTKKTIVGSIGKVGTHSSGTGTREVQNEVKSVGGDFGEQVVITYYTETVKYHYYRRQITPFLYREIQVDALSMTYYIKGSFNVISSDSKKIALIPIDHSITDNYSIPDRELLYSRSLHFIFNSYVETKVKWYQQAWFSFVLFVVAVVITLSGDYSGSALGAAIAAGTVTLEMLLVAAIVTAIEYLIIKLVAKLFVKLLGPEFAILVAVLVAVVAFYYGGANLKGTPWAKDLLSVASGMMTETKDFYTKELQGLAVEADEFNIFAKGEMEKIEKANKLLEYDTRLAPLIVWGEKPAAYYNRTVHSGNIGVLGLDAIHNYTSVALRLPELSDSLQDPMDA